MPHIHGPVLPTSHAECKRPPPNGFIVKPEDSIGDVYRIPMRRFSVRGVVDPLLLARGRMAKKAVWMEGWKKQARSVEVDVELRRLVFALISRKFHGKFGSGWYLRVIEPSLDEARRGEEGATAKGGRWSLAATLILGST